MLEILRLTPAMCCPSKIIGETVRKKFTKADVIKRMMKEHKATFGSLLETKREKDRRLKLEKSGALIRDDPESFPGDSELSWMLKVSDSRLRVVKRNNQQYSASISTGKIDSIFTDEDDKIRREHSTIIQQTSETELPKNKSSQPIFTMNRQSKPLLQEKLPQAGKVKIVRPTQILSKFDPEEDDKLRRKHSAIIEQTPETELPKNKSSQPIFTMNRQSKPLLQEKVSQAGKVKIVRPLEASVAAQKNLIEIDIEDREKGQNKASILQLQENIEDSMKDWSLNRKSSMGTASKSIFPKAIVNSEQNTNENESIQHQEEGKTNSSMLLSCHDIVENIKRAQLFNEEDENPDAELSSEILSISPKQREHIKLPSVTHILNATMSDNAKKMLELWTARMIQQMGQEGFDEYKKGLLQNGKLLHSVIDSSLRKMPVEIPDNLKSCYTSVKIVLDEVENVRAIESQVVHQNLGYRGVVDCVASYRGKLCLIDWKKSDKTKYLLSSTYDAPLQIASYIGALNADETYPYQIKSGLLVIAYTMGEPSTVFSLDSTKLQYYWKQWLGRLKKYYTMQNT